MRGLRIACVMFVFIVGLNALLVKYIHTNISELDGMLSDCYRELLCSGVYDDEKIVIIHRKLDSTLPIMRIIVNHNETDEIERCLFRISGAYDVQSKDALIYMAELRFHISNVLQREMPSFDNLF